MGNEMLLEVDKPQQGLYFRQPVDSAVTPGTLRRTTYQSRHPDGGLRWKGKTDWFPRNDSCYRYITAEIPWGDAEVYCQGLAPGSHLASAHSEDENKYLKDLAFWHTIWHRAFWVGASDCYKDRHFQWTDGTLLDFKSWHPEEPFSSGGWEHCVCSNFKGPGLWGDVRCDSNLTFICKAPNPPQGKPFCKK
ncbi:lectin-like [Lissotriton helveticus]